MKNSWVYAGKENGWVNVDYVEFIDISEGPYGDEMTFEFNGAEYVSNIIFGSQPG